MPSTRKQKAKERRLRQLDIMSDVENVDVMLGSYPRNNEENDLSENDINLDSESSRPQRNSNVTGEDFRLQLTNSRGNSEATIETTRLINEEIANQMSKKLNEIKTSLNSQIQNAITAAITDTVLPSIQNTLEVQGRANFTMVDQASSGLYSGPRTNNFTMGDRGRLQPNPEVGNSQKTCKNCPETCFTQENSEQRSRESSVGSYIGAQNRDRRVCPFLFSHTYSDCTIFFEF